MRTVLAAVAGAALLCVGSAWSAPMVNLNGQSFVQYGDGQSYMLQSLVDLPVAFGGCGGVKNGCQYYVESTPGAIKDLVVVATGTENNPATTNFSGQDKAYRTPDGTASAVFFRPDSNTDGAGTSRGVTGTINNNGTSTWDTSLAALKTFLGSDQMVFFFNNNQTNAGGASTQSLAAWAQISITDAAGTILGVWEFTNNGGKYELFTQGGGGAFNGDVGSFASADVSAIGSSIAASGLVGAPDAGNNSATDYVLSGGQICNNASFLPVPCSDPTSVGLTNNNLGANQAAYALLFPELNSAMAGLFGSQTDAALANYTMHIDVRLGCDPATNTVEANCTGNGTTIPFGRDLNNGYEQIFIGRAATADCPRTDPQCNPVPLPGSVWLAAIGLVGLARTQVRRFRQR